MSELNSNTPKVEEKDKITSPAQKKSTHNISDSIAAFSLGHLESIVGPFAPALDRLFSTIDSSMQEMFLRKGLSDMGYSDEEIDNSMELLKPRLKQEATDRINNLKKRHSGLYNLGEITGVGTALAAPGVELLKGAKFLNKGGTITKGIKKGAKVLSKNIGELPGAYGTIGRGIEAGAKAIPGANLATKAITQGPLTLQAPGTISALKYVPKVSKAAESIPAMGKAFKVVNDLAIRNPKVAAALTAISSSISAGAEGAAITKISREAGKEVLNPSGITSPPIFSKEFAKGEILPRAVINLALTAAVPAGSKLYRTFGQKKFKATGDALKKEVFNGLKPSQITFESDFPTLEARAANSRQNSNVIYGENKALDILKRQKKVPAEMVLDGISQKYDKTVSKFVKFSEGLKRRGLRQLQHIKGSGAPLKDIVYLINKSYIDSSNKPAFVKTLNNLFGDKPLKLGAFQPRTLEGTAIKYVSFKRVPIMRQVDDVPYSSLDLLRNEIDDRINFNRKSGDFPDVEKSLLELRRNFKKYIINNEKAVLNLKPGEKGNYETAMDIQAKMLSGREDFHKFKNKTDQEKLSFIFDVNEPLSSHNKSLTSFVQASEDLNTAWKNIYKKFDRKVVNPRDIDALYLNVKLLDQSFKLNFRKEDLLSVIEILKNSALLAGGGKLGAIYGGFRLAKMATKGLGTSGVIRKFFGDRNFVKDVNKYLRLSVDEGKLFKFFKVAPMQMKLLILNALYNNVDYQEELKNRKGEK